MSKNFEMAVLLDFYGDLLTEKQAQALELYYNEDLSLAEIAAPLHISRQGVRDSIKRGEKQLLEYEAALGLVKRFRDVKTEISDIREKFQAIENYIQTYIHSDKLLKAATDLSDRLSAITDKL